ncbi:MAG TPA: anaerobic ribonucleoside-triphosphate reductase activating protein [bacterium]|nr:anaerobic ribonucleoside-triphosphate reductase activating protein [bacterium]
MNRCRIKGFQGTSLIDYPGRIASIIFTGGCNLRCRYCYNGSLIDSSELPDIDTADVLSQLKLRRGFIEGVVITGGEPTVQPGIIDIMRAIRRIGLDIKLDTNGTNPDVIEWVIEENLAEYIAMDYKAPLARYESVTGVAGVEDRIFASAQLLMKRALRYEFRTTVHPLTHSLEDIETIAFEISGARAYFLQQYHSFGSLDQALTETPAFENDFFIAAAERITGSFNTFSVRNLPAPMPSEFDYTTAYTQSPDQTPVSINLNR